MSYENDDLSDTDFFYGTFYRVRIGADRACGIDIAAGGKFCYGHGGVGSQSC